MSTAIHIRPLAMDDRFERILAIINHTANRSNRSLHYSGTVEHIRDYAKKGTGFVAEHDDKIVGFMAGGINPDNHDAGLEFGFENGYEYVLSELLDHFSSVMRKQGAKKVNAMCFLEFGQLRNKMMTSLESLGFRPEDEYSWVALNINLEAWEAPTNLDVSGIGPVVDSDIGMVRQILIEDGELMSADLLRDQFSIHSNSSEYHPDHVILSLKHRDSGSMAGIAYYRVFASSQDGNSNVLGANAFGLYCRPQFQIDRFEKRRFLQGVYLSMKQLGVKRVVSRMSCHDFELFAAIAAEGFIPGISSSAYFVQISKKLE